MKPFSKLSPAQHGVLRDMADGWKLKPVQGSGGSVFAYLFRDGGHGRFASSATLRILRDAGLVEWSDGTYRLTGMGWVRSQLDLAGEKVEKP